MLPRVKDYMDTIVHTLRPETPILEAVNFLLDHHVTGAPVVDADNRVLGVLSEKECLKLLSVGDNHNLPDGSVADFMIRKITAISPEMNIYFAAGMFLNDEVRRFPVVRDGRLVGAITRFDILRAIRESLD